MAQRENPDTETLIAGALDWWRDAGVDRAYLDEPVQWLTPEEARPEPQRQPEKRRDPTPSPAGQPPGPAPPAAPARMPETLEDFAPWWMSEATLAEGTLSTRVPPRGPRGAELMVIVPEPEAGDRDRLLSGPQGRLLDAMLASFGIAPDAAYVASALPRHLPGADWDDPALRAMGAILARHVQLAAPRRLAVFGTNILPLMGNALPQGPADLRIFNHEDTNWPMLAARSLAALLEQPRWKARVWQTWLEWTA